MWKHNMWEWMARLSVRRVWFSFLSLFLLLTGQAVDASFFSGSQAQPCTFPAGIYNAHQLGGGYDSLTLIATTGGEFRGVYRVLASEYGYGQAPLYQTWLDGQSADLKCHGDTVDATLYGLDGRGLQLTMMWNRALSTLEVSGTWTGLAAWPRWTAKNGFRLLAFGAMAYGGYYTWQHWQDVKTFQRGMRWIVGDQRGVLIDGVMYTAPFAEFNYGGLTGNGISQLRQVLFRYFGQEHIRDFTLPMIGGAVSALSDTLIGTNSTYPLEGHGLRQVTSRRAKACHIPAGIYKGQWLDSSLGTFAIDVPIGQENGKSWPLVSVSTSNGSVVYKTEPWRFECHGGEILLDWEHSEPSSRGAFVAYYDEDTARLIGAGSFAATGWSTFLQSRSSWHHFIVDNLPLTSYENE